MEHLTAGEYLSQFRKKDRLIPIISLVFYYGSEPWDGPVDLYDMFQLESTKEENEILEKYLPNYKINLVDAERLEDVEKFSDDLQVILTMLRYRDSKEELTDYINENKKFFQNVDYETSQAMKAFLNMKQIPGEAEHKEEMIDMCKAIQEMYDDGVKDGIQKGVERGIAAVIRTCRNLNVSEEDTLNNVQREYELSMEEAKKYHGDILEITRGKKNKKLLITTIIDRCELLKCSGCRNVAGDFCNLLIKFPSNKCKHNKGRVDVKLYMLLFTKGGRGRVDKKRKSELSKRQLRENQMHTDN